jgi:hypothetical protein
LGSNAEMDIRKHPFFASIDWAKLEKKELRPPFVPTIKDDDSIKYVHPAFRRMDPVDNESGEPDQAEGEAGYAKEMDFESFAYAPAK